MVKILSGISEVIPCIRTYAKASGVLSQTAHHTAQEMDVRRVRSSALARAAFCRHPTTSHMAARKKGTICYMGIRRRKNETPWRHNKNQWL